MRGADHNRLSIFLPLASIFREWPGAVSRGLLFPTSFSFPLVVFLVLLSLSLLGLIVSLFPLSFSFLSERLMLLFVHVKAALAYS